MASPEIEVAEHIGSQEMEDGVAGQRLYLVKGTDDPAEVVRQVLGVTEVEWQGLRRQPVRITPSFVIDEAPEHCLWTVEVPYAAGQRSTPPKTGETVRSFSTTGGTAHITSSLSTALGKSRYLPGADIKDKYGQAIGVTKDGVEGCDIVVPEVSEVITRYMPYGQFDSAYKATLKSLTGKVNDAEFLGYAAGRVLFLGAEATARGKQDYEVTYRFAVGDNVTGLEFGEITDVDKQAWQYLWVSYSDYVAEFTEGATTVKTQGKRPEEVFVENVYLAATFSALGAE